MCLASTGTASPLCFNRRFHHDVMTKAVINVDRLRPFLQSQADGAATMKHVQILLRYASGSVNGGAARGDRFNNITNHVAPVDVTSVTATTEELLLYETEKTEAALAISTKAWQRILQGWGIGMVPPGAAGDPSARIAKRLKPGWGSRSKPAPHANVIYNHREVKEALFSDPRLQKYTWMWRD